MSRADRSSVSRFSGAENFWTVTALGRLNSRKPSAPWMRPNPDSPMPPNGNDGIPAKPRTEFTDTMPVRRRSAMSLPRLRFDVKTDAPRPYEVAFARSMPSSMSRTG